MTIATVHIESFEGIYPGVARCFKLESPVLDQQTGVEHEYVTVVIQEGYLAQMLPQVLVFAANDIGGPIGPSMKRMPGSYVLHGYTGSQTDVDGAFALALLHLGVTRITGYHDSEDSTTLVEMGKTDA